MTFAAAILHSYRAFQRGANVAAGRSMNPGLRATTRQPVKSPKKPVAPRATAAIVFLGLLTCALSANAQEARGYVGGGLMVLPWGGAHSLNGGASTTYSNTGPEAVNVGVLGEVAWFLDPTLAVAVEAALPFQRNPVTQGYGYFSPYRLVGRYREQTFSFVLRAQTPQPSRVRAAALGGISIIHGSLRLRTSTGRFDQPGVFPPLGDERTLSKTGHGATFGAELAVAITTHVHIVPQFRVVVIDRGSVTTSNKLFATFGFDKVVYRVGTSVRATF
jgi:hypothetical protein